MISISAQTAVGFGRLALGLGFISLLGAWLTQLSGQSFLGMSQNHLFNDAIVLSLLGIGMLLDARFHNKGI